GCGAGGLPACRRPLGGEQGETNRRSRRAASERGSSTRDLPEGAPDERLVCFQPSGFPHGELHRETGEPDRGDREPLSPSSRFTITPQRHYPLQQPGVSSLGVLPPVRWDGFRQKNILSPRNSPAALSPVTVKIARPDHHITPRSGKLPSIDDYSFCRGTGLHNTDDWPGNLKRGMTSLAEESILKRSRTSSISSGSGVHAPRGTPGSKRNPIHSSYSSTIGLSQKRSAPSSPLSSPGSSRCQTPEGVSKRPSFVFKLLSNSLVFHDVALKLTPAPKVPVSTSTDSAGSGGKRKRKIQLVSSNRDDQISLPPPPELGYTITVKDLDEEKKEGISKIQKVLETPGKKNQSISLLAAPLVTAASSAIPVINLDPSPSSSVTTAPAIPNPLLEALKKSITPAPVSSTPAATSTTGTITSHFPLSASTTPVQPSSLTLKVSTTVDSPQLPPASQPQSSSAVGEQHSAFMQVLSQVSKAPSSTPSLTGASLFGLTSQITTSTTSSSASNLVPASSAPLASSSESVSNTNPLLASGFKPIFAVTTTSSGTPTPESKPAVPTFKPIFGAATPGSGFGQPSSIASTIPASSVASSMFGGLTSSTTVTPSLFPGMTNTTTNTASTGSITATPSVAQPAMSSLFGNWSAPSTTSTSSSSTQAPNTGSTFQFGAAATTAPAPAAAAAATTTSSNSTFSFGAPQPDPQAASQKVFGFGQTASTQNTTTASFGGFAMANTTSNTTAAATTQPTFSFGKSSFQAPPAAAAAAAAAAPPAAAATQPTFGSSAAQSKPFTFGGSGAPSAPVANTAPPPFPFGSTAVTTAPSFGTPAQPAFGASSTGFAFGSTTAPSAAPTAAPSFGAATQTQSSSSATFTFGSAAPQPAPPGPAQPAPSGFNFGGGMQVPQFGTPVSNNPAPQMGFNFGAAATDKPAFGSPSATFSIGAGSKPSGARQRLQARRQHTRKK
uniref:POM121 transmembrane nucleoporin n=1 Tax=Labrus bergylta TaxID=56723 RepID=A0A3Q3ET43_9LABR